MLVGRCAKFLNAYQKDVRDLTVEDIGEADFVVAIEMFDNMIAQDLAALHVLADKANVPIIYTRAKSDANVLDGNKRIGGDDNMDMFICMPGEDQNETDTSTDTADVRETTVCDESSPQLPLFGKIN